MFKTLIEHVDGMLNFRDSHSNSQMEEELENFRNGCEQLKVVLTEANDRMKLFDEKLDSIINKGVSF